MARVENTSERNYDLHGTVNGNITKVTIPRSNGETGAAKINGSAEIPDDMLDSLKDDPFTKAVFESGDLVKATGAVATTKPTSARTDLEPSKPPADPDHDARVVVGPKRGDSGRHDR
jgi:hypothetical protein